MAGIHRPAQSTGAGRCVVYSGVDNSLGLPGSGPRVYLVQDTRRGWISAGSVLEADQTPSRSEARGSRENECAIISNQKPKRGAPLKPVKTRQIKVCITDADLARLLVHGSSPGKAIKALLDQVDAHDGKSIKGS
jgi:hypothetical protein